jgi:single-stranded-DNA-specific exonuclease
MIRSVWEDVPVDDGRAAAIGAALGVPPVVARLLAQRGFDSPEEADKFLRPSIAHLHDPYRLAGLREAAQRLREAVARRESIVVHGDYDVDGMTATVLLRRALELMGGRVSHFVPERAKDGYGIQATTIERLHAEGASVIVSVDCGIRATEAARRARELGVDLIITDHHEPDAELPPAFAVINPKRRDCTYPDKMLAGAGVALKLAQALLADDPRVDELLPHFVKIAAIGTLADVVPLIGENRVIASCGLAGLSVGPHGAGIEALLDGSGLLGRTLDSFHVSFMLAPRLNAAGRMSSPELALELLLLRGRDEAVRARARDLARQLGDENVRRQEHEAAMFAEARRIVEGDPHVGGQNLLIVVGEGWHRGVVGIVASKLVEAYGKPAIVLSVEDGIARGSGRTIPAFDLLACLESAPDVFEQFGGHKMAAGLTLEASRIDEMRRRLTAYANERLSPEDFVPRLRIDARLGLPDITGEVVQALSKMGPFGMANPKPVFRTSAVDLVNAPRTLKERHLALLVKQAGRTFRAMAWRAADRSEYLTNNRYGLDLAYSLNETEFRGERVTELTVADIRVPVEVPA